MFPKKYKYWISNTKTQTKKNRNSESKIVINNFLDVQSKFDWQEIVGILWNDVLLRENRLWLDWNYWNIKNKFLFSVNELPYFKNNGTLKILNQKNKNQKFLKKVSLFSDDIEEDDFSFWEKNLINARKLLVKLKGLWLVKVKENIKYLDVKEKVLLNSQWVFGKIENIKNYEIKYFIDKKWISLPLYTTDPELIFSDVAIAISPKDRRYKKYHGKDVIIPIINKVIPIILDESIDSTMGTGVFRVNPGHCKRSFELAKKHKLETNLKTVDKKGNFTDVCGEEFAGKRYLEFNLNVIKYLQDIGNLKEIWETEKEIFYSKHNENLLIPSLEKLLYIEKFEEHENEEIQNNENKEKNWNENYLEEKRDLAFSQEISQDSVFGTLSWVFFEEWHLENEEILSVELILDKYQELKSKDNLALSLVILHLMFDGLLDSEFKSEDLIQAIFHNSNSAIKISKIEIYLKLFFEEIEEESLKIQISELLEIIEKLKKWEDVIWEFENILGKSFLIENLEEGYKIDFEKIFDRRMQFYNWVWLSSGFLNIVKMIKIIENKKNNDEFVILESFENKNEIELFFEIGKCLNLDFDKIQRISFPEIFNEKVAGLKSKKFETICNQVIKSFDSDILKLILLNGEFKDDIEINNIEDYDNFMQKIWNGFRFVYSITWKDKHKNMEEVIQNLKTEWKKLSEFDILFFHKTNEFVNKIDNMSYLENGKEKYEEVSLFLKNFFDVYVQIVKDVKEENTLDLLLFLSYRLLNKLLEIVPIIAEKLIQIFGFEDIILELEEEFIEQKKYSAHIFIDMVKSIKKLREENNIKKHQEIDMQIKISGDWKDFFNNHIAIVKSILRTNEIEVLNWDQDIDYDIRWTIFGIEYGIKLTNNQASKKDIILDIKNEIKITEDELQRKKILLTKIIASLSNEDIQARRDEIECLKNKLEELKSKLI